jgi:hypothetical protein
MSCRSSFEIGQVITVSLETVKIVRSLPALGL